MSYSYRVEYDDVSVLLDQVAILPCSMPLRITEVIQVKNVQVSPVRVSFSVGKVFSYFKIPHTPCLYALVKAIVFYNFNADTGTARTHANCERPIISEREDQTSKGKLPSRTRHTR